MISRDSGNEKNAESSTNFIRTIDAPIRPSRCINLLVSQRPGEPGARSCALVPKGPKISNLPVSSESDSSLPIEAELESQSVDFGDKSRHAGRELVGVGFDLLSCRVSSGDVAPCVICSTHQDNLAIIGRDNGTDRRSRIGIRQRRDPAR